MVYQVDLACHVLISRRIAMMTNKINLVDKEASKQQIAYEKIKEAIVKNEIMPDTLFVERQLCANLGISRTPIREALRRLSSEGLVDSIPDKGMFVSRIRLEDIIEIYEIREALETMAIRLFTFRKTEEEMKRFEECIKNYEMNFTEGNYATAIALDMEFHEIYIKGARNNRMENILKSIRDQNSRVAFSTVADLERTRKSLEQHKKIFEAVRANEPDQAENLLREHLLDIKDYHISRFYLVR